MTKLQFTLKPTVFSERACNYYAGCFSIVRRNHTFQEELRFAMHVHYFPMWSSCSHGRLSAKKLCISKKHIWIISVYGKFCRHSVTRKRQLLPVPRLDGARYLSDYLRYFHQINACNCKMQRKTTTRGIRTRAFSQLPQIDPKGKKKETGHDG
jgi:hypothetical protein